MICEENCSEKLKKIVFVGSGPILYFCFTVASYSIYKHYTNYKSPNHQEKIIVISLACFTIGVLTLFCSLYPDLYYTFAFIKNIYLATSFHLLYGLLITYLTSGNDYLNESTLIQFLLEKKILKPAFPLNLCCSNEYLTSEEKAKNFLKSMKRSILQFIFVLPSLGLLNLIYFKLELPDYLFVLNELLAINSMFLCFYRINKFYLAFEEKMNLKILNKLLVLEIFFMFLLGQNLIIDFSFLTNNTFDSTNIVTISQIFKSTIYFKNLVIDCEILIFSMIIFYCYHYSEFETIKFEQPIVNVADRKKKKYEELQEKEHEHEHEVSSDYK